MHDLQVRTGRIERRSGPWMYIVLSMTSEQQKVAPHIVKLGRARTRVVAGLGGAFSEALLRSAERVYMDGHRGLERSMDCAAQCPIPS